MSWFRSWADKEDKKTFEQDLALLIARWQDRSRKEDRTLTEKQIGEKLLDRAEQLLDPPPRERS